MTVYFFTADRTPMGIASVQVNITVLTPSTIVIARRSFTNSVTGLPHSSEIPKFHWSIPQTHFAYCTYKGRFSPYWFRSASI